MALHHPDLVASIGGRECARLTAPDELGARAWLLAVMAVQVTTTERATRAVLRVNRTGLDPNVIELGDAAVVHIAVGEMSRPSHIAPPTAPQLALFVDGELVRAEPLDAGAARSPPPRAFGHVYSRWLRSGGHETGYDITPFASVPRGIKHARSVSGDADVGQVISYAVCLR